jgi:hypothetical protein
MRDHLVTYIRQAGDLATGQLSSRPLTRKTPPAHLHRGDLALPACQVIARGHGT